MSRNSTISRRNVLKGAAASIAGALATSATPAFALEGAQTLLSTQAVDFLYINEEALTLGATQQVVVCFKELRNLISATLTLANTSTGETLDVALATAADASALFTFVPASEGTYSVEHITLEASGSSYVVDFTDTAAEDRCFSTAGSEAELSLLSAGDGTETTEGELETNFYVSATDNADEATAFSSLDEAIAATDQGTATLALSASSTSWVIGLDAGHGGFDSGAIGVNGVHEADLTWKIANYCADELKQYSDVVIVWAESKGENPSIKQRVQNCYDQGANMVISFHLNASNGSARGAMVLIPGTQKYNVYAHTMGDELAGKILEQLKALGISISGATSDGRYLRYIDDADGYEYPTGEHGDYYGIVRHARKLGIPGIIIEHCFVDNAADYNSFLNSDAKLKALGVADATGIANALGLEKGASNSGPVKMNRLYNPNSGEHFYTARTNETNVLTKAGWKYEGVGWTAPRNSKTPVYRLYNPYVGDHHYTMDVTERDYLVKLGWNDEGIGWYSDDDKAVPLYRQYNPYATVGTHNYTTSKAENDALEKLGWKTEGTAWYGVKSE